MIELTYIDTIIQCRRQYLKWRVIYTVVILSVGVTILVVTYSAKMGDGLKTIANIGSALVISISAWPIKEILDINNSLRLFEELKKLISKLRESKGDYTSELDNIKVLVREAVKKIAIV